MSLLSWIAGLFRKHTPAAPSDEEPHFAPGHRHRLDTAAANAARGAESGTSSVPLAFGP